MRSRAQGLISPPTSPLPQVEPMAHSVHWAHLCWELLVTSTTSPEGSAQTDSDFQWTPEDNKDGPAHAGSKNQQIKDPDLPRRCLAVRDNWGIISHLHLYLGPTISPAVLTVLNKVLSSPARCSLLGISCCADIPEILPDLLHLLSPSLSFWASMKVPQKWWLRTCPITTSWS